jgi:hypothetical protein
MKIKIMNVVFGLVLGLGLVGLSVSTTHAATFSDNFNDGDTKRWELGGSLSQPWILGSWRVDNGALLQDNAFDGVWVAIEHRVISDALASVDIRQIYQSAGLGFLFWFRDNYNWSHVVAIPGVQTVVIDEYIDGVSNPTYFTVNNMHDGGGWYNLKAEINSVNGIVKVYIEDELVATRTLTTPIRSGKFALETGNAGGWFDNFKLTNKLPKH